MFSNKKDMTGIKPILSVICHDMRITDALLLCRSLVCAGYIDGNIDFGVSNMLPTQQLHGEIKFGSVKPNICMFGTGRAQSAQLFEHAEFIG